MRYVGSEYDDLDDDENEEIEDDSVDDEDDSDGPPPRVSPFGSTSGTQRTSTLPGANQGRSSLPGAGSPQGGNPSRLPGSVGQQNRPTSPSSPQSGQSTTPRYGGPSGSSMGGSAQSASPARPGSSGGSQPSSGGTSPFGSRYPSTTQSSSGSGSSSPSSSAFGARSPGSSGSPSSGGARPPVEEKKSGGLLSGISNPLKRGDDKSSGSKPPAGGKPASGGALSGLTSRFTGSGSSTPSKPGSSQPSSGVGGLFSKLRPGAKPEEKPGDKRSTGTSSAFKPSSPSSPGSSSPFGGSKLGTPPSAQSASSVGGAKKPLFGSAGGAPSASSRPATAKADAQPSGLSRFLPFGLGGTAEKKPDKKPRPSKAPKIESGGLSLDHKLDILGVALVLGSLALGLSRLSTTKGQLTEWLNGIISQTFGWGAIVVLVAMMAVGIWLIARHFGDEAPVIPSRTIVGLVILYVGVLILMQYIDTYSYVNPNGSVVTLDALQSVWLPISIARGSGGGWVGANLYFLLVSNITEYGAFLVSAGLLIVGTMFILGISAAELAMIFVSVGRSFGDARQNRAQRRAQAAAPGLEQLTAEAAPAFSISKPEPTALPAAQSTPALPAATREPALPAGPLVQPERNISINIGGRNTGPSARGELQPVENVPAKPGQQPAASLTPAPAGGFGSRLRGAIPSINIPGRNSASAESVPTATNPSSKVEPARTTAPDKMPEKMPEKPAGAMSGIRGMFNRQPTAAKAEAVPEKPASTPDRAAPAFAKPATSPAMTISGAPAAAKPLTSPVMDEEPARLGDLLKPNNGQPARPATQAPPRSMPPAPTMPATNGGTGLGARVSAESAPAVRSPGGLPSTQAPASRPIEAAKPFGAAPPSPFKAPAKPEDLLDDEDDFDDDELDIFDEDDEQDDVTNLAPAQPKGTGPLPRPDDNRPRVAPSPFGAPKPAAAAVAPVDRQDRLNAIRSGNVGTPTNPNENGTRRDVPQQAAASVGAGAPAAPQASPARPVTQPPPVTAAYPSDAEKKPQPAAAFWKPAGENQTAVAETAAKAGGLPPPVSAPPAPSYGRPTTPPGAPPINMPSHPAPTINTSGSPAPVMNGQQPPPPSPEIVLRQPGVGTTAPMHVKKKKEWKLPNASSLLSPGSEGDVDRESLLRRARIIEDTLNSFGAPGKVVEVNTGPVITQFGVEPDYLLTRGGKKNRVKVSAIAQLDKDLQLALGAKSIRIEAPVPGKGYVGIEVPNDVPSLVSLRDVMESDNFKRIKSPLAIALGQSVDGTPISADLTGMPHLLVAGTTGSGKSVCVNAIITSLLIHNPPDRVKFIMVDPKRVELTGYNGIPHLVAPVVVDLERIVGVLKWVTREMDERYKRFSNAGARNIEDFNGHLAAGEEMMPYIVVIIDELADLMMLAPDETERVITRIAALARATGIHLVIATQRPSVDVVTGLIKANFPARIAFAVAGGVDSRVILDQPGAERLLGRGDMLYMSGDSPSAVRLQGVFVSDTEINNITRYWKGQMTEDDSASKPISALVLDHSIAESGRSVMPNNDRAQIQQAFWDRDNRPGSPATTTSSSSGGPNGGDDNISDDQEDELYEEAVEMVRRLNKASVSLLQRRLRIGYTRAARLIDRMEEEKIVGPAVEGSKPREVLPLR